MASANLSRHPKLIILDYYQFLINEIDIYTQEQLERYTDDRLLTKIEPESTRIQQQTFDASKFRIESVSYEGASWDESFRDSYSEEYECKQRESVYTPDKIKMCDYLNSIRDEMIAQIRRAEAENLEHYEAIKSSLVKVDQDASRKLYQKQIECLKKKLFEKKFCYLLELDKIWTESEQPGAKKLVPNNWPFKLCLVVLDFYLSPQQQFLLKIRPGKLVEEKFTVNKETLLIFLLEKFVRTQTLNLEFASRTIQVTKKEILSAKKASFLFIASYYKKIEFDDILEPDIDFSDLEFLGVMMPGDINSGTKQAIIFDNLSGLSNLVYLSLGFLQFGQKAFLHLKNLCYLKLHDCNFSSVDDKVFRHMPNLKVLINDNPNDAAHITYECVNNHLKHLMISDAHKVNLSRQLCQSLRVLSIANSLNLFKQNMLGEILKGFDSSSELVTLNLFSSKISVFSGKWLSEAKNLRHLSLAYNELTKLDLNYEFLSNLETLFLSNNQFVSLEYAFDKLTNLKTLYLCNNLNLNHMLSAKMFDGLVNLEHLYLSNIIQKSFLGEISRDCFRSTRNLKYLDLKSNHLVYLDPETFSFTPNLVQLDLACNKLKIDATSFLHLKNLKLLNLAENWLSGLGYGKMFAPLESLEQLSLASNPLLDIQASVFESKTRLKYVNLRWTQIPAEILNELSEFYKSKIEFFY